MKMKQKLSLALLLILVLSFAMSTPTYAAVRINRKSIVIATYAPRKLTITGTSKKVTWKSSNTKVVKVSKNGYLTGKKKGTAVVTATVGKKKFKCKVTVINMNGVKRLFKKKAVNKMKNTAGIVEMHRDGKYLNIWVGRPMGDGVMMTSYRVDLKTGYANVTEKYTWEDYFRKMPKKVKLF